MISLPAPAVSLAGNVPDLLRPELLLVPALDCLHLYGQPVAVPAGHIVHPPPSGHLTSQGHHHLALIAIAIT